MSTLEPTPEGFRSGFVALIGRPNVGKSTLINQFVGEKVAITSPVAQTTRNRLRAILTINKAQLVFVDTPGIHKPHHLLGERLVNTSKKVIGEVDSILLIFDGNEPPGSGDSYIVKLLKGQNIPVTIVLNKWDLVTENQRTDRIKEYISFFNNTGWNFFCCSAINGKGCDGLIQKISSTLPVGPLLYPSGVTSDQPEEILMRELIREQVLLNTREEIPHSVAVSIDRIEEMTASKKKGVSKKRIAILATVLVERKSQKGILIGKGGSMLKKIGKGARMQIQKLLNGPVYLELFVKVVPDWRSKPARLAELGFGEK
ncbi:MULTISPECIES: GTPase Era [Prochlorococcus]|uniref:GTPase Era n=1 Tax=Prochlorococcus marinus (strain SARG / CCMP1375 / SS120) TaxID=167539 RepID=Q7VAU9_PROMA|nr:MULTISPECIES: GTPase Era [Prochlorococcus]AAQ00399.1 GTPase, Era homolog [Prochlorococcus marinus subsp. marinus str. CCMP1375]KGG14280.1 GTP-binding protein Era [Prochlorococcus marinus str. LG]KGG22147.1 GTP-binding protein Era [Prochlorococcus marinus str. SS2]KGG24535.1 GTP-binding protein Era [Prochlorococcus marinus str. SS35]KGG33430.1 GTP-binding protein Era [Prochlorococcus marinus str. SS51]